MSDGGTPGKTHEARHGNAHGNGSGGRQGAAGWIRAGAPGRSVEMRRVADTVEVREGDAAEDGPVLRFTLAEWAAWLDGAKAGEFDHLT